VKFEGIRRVENYSDFHKLVRVIQHCLQGFWVKKSKISQRTQTIPIIFFISESVMLIISNIVVIFTNPLKEAFETAAQLNEEVS